VIAAYAQRETKPKTATQSLESLNEKFPKDFTDHVIVVYEHEMWIIPQQRWGRDREYDGKCGGRSYCPRWVDEEGVLPDCTDADDTPYVELPPGFTWQSEWMDSGWEYSARCNELGEAFGPKDEDQVWSTTQNVREHNVRRKVYKRVLRSMEGKAYTSRMYQQLLAHTTACYQPPLPAYPHSEVALEAPVAFAERLGYARDVAKMMACTIPPEFLTEEILGTRLQRPETTGWLRRDVWEENQHHRLKAMEKERLKFWPTIENKWAAEDAANHQLCLALKDHAETTRKERKQEFEDIVSKTKRLIDDATHQRELSEQLVADWDIYGYTY